MDTKEQNKSINNLSQVYTNMFIKNIQIRVRSDSNNALITAEGPPGTYVYFYLSYIDVDKPIRAGREHTIFTAF